LALILCSILAPEGQYGTIRYSTVVTVESYDIDKVKEKVKEKEDKDKEEKEKNRRRKREDGREGNNH
jgi:hypothetical protein